MTKQNVHANGQTDNVKCHFCKFPQFQLHIYTLTNTITDYTNHHTSSFSPIFQKAMTGYTQNPSGYNQQYYSASYGAAPPPYGQHQPSHYSHAAGPYGAPSASSPYGTSSPFAALLPSTFPPGTDPNVIACFQMADLDGSGSIDDNELQRSLSAYNQSFSIRTVRLLMYHFTNTNTRKIGTSLSPIKMHRHAPNQFLSKVQFIRRHGSNHFSCLSR